MKARDRYFVQGVYCQIDGETMRVVNLGLNGLFAVTHRPPSVGETVIVDKRESKSRTDSGIVYFEHRGYNQKGELVCKAKRAGLMVKNPSA